MILGRHRASPSSDRAVRCRRRWRSPQASLEHISLQAVSSGDPRGDRAAGSARRAGSSSAASSSLGGWVTTDPGARREARVRAPEPSPRVARRALRARAAVGQRLLTVRRTRHRADDAWTALLDDLAALTATNDRLVGAGTRLLDAGKLAEYERLARRRRRPCRTRRSAGGSASSSSTSTPTSPRAARCSTCGIGAVRHVTPARRWSPPHRDGAAPPAALSRNPVRSR